jgi:hypothetical protein
MHLVPSPVFELSISGTHVRVIIAELTEQNSLSYSGRCMNPWWLAVEVALTHARACVCVCVCVHIRAR